MPCAMSSLRGASGVVGCDRVVCPLVLHATTIAHLDVLLCTLLFFLLCAVLLCGAVPLSCGVPCVLPALPVVWLRGAVAVVCGCVLPLLSLSCGVPCVLPALPVVWLRGAVAVVCGCVLPLLSLSLWMCATVCPVLPVSCLPYFLGIIPALYMGVLYAGLVHSLYTCPIFRLAIYDPFCTHSKSRPLDSECGFPKVGLNFRCSVFLFAEFSPVKFPA